MENYWLSRRSVNACGRARLVEVMFHVDGPTQFLDYPVLPPQPAASCFPPPLLPDRTDVSLEDGSFLDH
eukprot:1907103-Alexandrium_andersonii.AAC.1